MPSLREVPKILHCARNMWELSVYDSALMEALKMGSQVNSWSDDRLDELSRRTERGFGEVKGEVKELSRRTDKGFDEVKGEIKDLSRRTDKSFDEVKGEIKDLSRRTDKGFEEVKGEIKDLSRRTDEGFKEVRQELKHSNRTMIGVGGTVVAAIIGSGILG